MWINLHKINYTKGDPMKIALLEDKPIDLCVLLSYIQAYCRKHCFAADIESFGTGEALLDAFCPGAFDLLFLDIFLSGLSGLETARKIRETDRDCMLVFITESPDFAMDGFLVGAAGYVVKPVSQEKMSNAMHACRFVFERDSRAIELPVGGENIPISVADIFYAEVFDKEVIFHMKRGTFKSRLPFETVEKRLGGVPFLRCNRSYIINMNYVDDMREDDFLMRNGDFVPIRKNSRREIRMAMAAFTARSPMGAY